MKNILVVDDDQFIRSIVKNMLEALHVGHQGNISGEQMAAI